MVGWIVSVALLLPQEPASPAPVATAPSSIMRLGPNVADEKSSWKSVAPCTGAVRKMAITAVRPALMALFMCIERKFFIFIVFLLS